MSQADGKHVFISYVREDTEAVDALCKVLEASGIPYWRDRTSLGPGDAWRAKIREAIHSGSMVFLACFSEASRAKETSYMNEELNLAVEELRKMPPGRTWMIPVRFDGGDLPYWEIGPGKSLGDFNFVDLYDDRYAAQAAALVTTIHGLMGDRQMGAAAALAAVDQATWADRVDLLRRLTKEMLVDPARRIELDELVSQEVQRVVAALSDEKRVVMAAGDGNSQVVATATEARALWDLVQPFCASLQVAARWGTPNQLTPWVSGIRSFVQAANKYAGGSTWLLEIRHVPGMLSIMVAGLACVSSGKWDNLKTLVYDLAIRDKQENKALSVLEATDPYAPFDSQDLTANALARATMENRPLGEVLEDLADNRVQKFYTPIAEWVFQLLRPLFADQLADDDTYAVEFDRAEVVLGVLAQDAVNVRTAADPERRRWARSRWFGRSSYRVNNGHGNPVEDLRHALAIEGAFWGPLHADMFGADARRATEAIDRYDEHFQSIARGRW